MTDTQYSNPGNDSGQDHGRDFTEADSRVDAIAALAVILILVGTALYFVAGG